MQSTGKKITETLPRIELGTSTDINYWQQVLTVAEKPRDAAHYLESFFSTKTNQKLASVKQHLCTCISYYTSHVYP